MPDTIKKRNYPEDAITKEAKASINRKIINKCPNCGRPHSIGELGIGTNLEIKCSNSDCKMFFYLTKLS